MSIDPLFPDKKRNIYVSSTQILPVSDWSGTANTLAACTWIFSRTGKVGVFSFRVQIAAPVNAWSRFALTLPGVATGFVLQPGGGFIGGGLASYGSSAGNISPGAAAALSVTSNNLLYVSSDIAANTNAHVRGTITLAYQ